ncbi:MAG: AAA domain-containing protein [Actinomycetota bacterium]|nr:AAA domain-containing protein [Actinomycetota bacterium]
MATKNGDGQRMAEILAYWHAVELFDPQDIPRPPRQRGITRQPDRRCVETISVANGVPPLPWQSGHPRYGELPETRLYGSTWRHVIYGGVFSLSAVRSALAGVPGYADGEDYAGTRDADGALFAFTVDADGLLIEDTPAFSSCAWATGRLHRPGPGAPGWLDGFGKVTGDCAESLYRLLSRPVSYLPLPPEMAPDGARDWRAAVTDILGGAGAGAVAALLGAIAPAVGGVVSAGALAGAAGAIINRATQRIERERVAAPLAAAPPSDAPATGGHGRPVQVPDVVAFAAHVAVILGLPQDVANPLELRVVSTPVWRKQDGSLPDPEPAFLSSPVLPDLERLKDAARLGPALASYLSDPEVPERRIDLRDDRETVLNGVRPGAFPPARWPSDVTKPLAVSQQFAVNTILAELAEGGCFSVNGPPGTGKTTLLRDLIAAIVVQRAEVLAGLPRPEAAFTRDPHAWTAPDGRRRVVKRLRPGLTGYEIVVASSNNNAVENVTKELPALAAIGAGWQDDAQYFRKQATAFLGEPAWGIVAAPLGNAEKRKQFRDGLWWGDSGMHALLRSLEKDSPQAGEWQAAVDRFTEALRVSAGLAAERAAADTSLRFPVGNAEVGAARNEAEGAAQELGKAEASRKRAAGAVIGLQRAVEALSGQAERHEQIRPGGLRGLLGMGQKVAAWQQRREELASRLGHRTRQVREAQQKVDRLTSRVVAARQRASDTARDAEVLINRRADDEQRIRRARAAWGSAFPEGWLELERDEQELAAPWSDEEWTTARTRVFLAALDLHRAFIAGAAGTIRRNLLQLVATLAKEPDAPPPDAELAAWQTLFLLVPAISTTFASCGRMFGVLGAESLGWVLIDEAGQAVPQHAAGALWRARRAVVVGDPLQLEPIFQVPAEVQDRLRGLFGIDRHWLPAATSVQGISDRRNRWGTEIPVENRDGDTEHVWVGAPLRVHRRCEQPMFEISNTIAYQGLMVYGTTAKSFPGGPHADYPRSSWVDVTGPAHGKWVPAQGDALLRILRRLHIDYEVSWADIYVLSPFRDVVASCRGLASTELKEHEFPSSHIGTVHTMQGKEADVVVLVLGTDPSPAEKARDWAARPANLLNVAVSRARRRLFIIGDQAEWRDAGSFSAPARILPTRTWPPAVDRPR